MKFSSLVDRVAGERADAWAIHFAATEAKRRGEDVIILSIGDPDFATPARITEAGIAALKAGDTHYTDIQGRPQLRQAIVDEFHRQSGVRMQADNVIVLAGAQNALFATTLCIGDAGDEFIVLDPMYLTYEATIQAAGIKMVTVPQDAARNFAVDPAKIAAAITSKTRAIFYASPSNPTGKVMSREDLEAIANLAKKHDLWVVADEVYADLTFDRPHISIASLPGMAERTVTVSSLSKSHAMTGWRIGWMIAPRPLIKHAENLSLAMLYGLPGFIQEAGLVALRDCADDVSKMREIYRRRRDLVLERLKKVDGIDCLTPEAGMFMLFSPARAGLSAHDFAWQLFKEEGVAVLDASPFGEAAKGYLRMSFTIDEASLEEACKRIARFTSAVTKSQPKRATA